MVTGKDLREVWGHCCDCSTCSNRDDCEKRENGYGVCSGYQYDM